MSGMEASFALAMVGLFVGLMSMPAFLEGLHRPGKILLGAGVALISPLALRLLVLAVLS